MENFTVLLVEDEVNMARVLEAQLRAAGYQVIWAANGQEGFKMALEQKPHLILTDIMMPFADGYELCRNVKHHPALRHIPVIMLSAKSDLASIIHSYSLGAAKYFVKPHKKAELVEAVDLRLKFADEARRRISRKPKQWEGTLDSNNLFAVLDLFSVGRWNGTIEIDNAMGRKGCIYLEQGSIVKSSLEGQINPYSLFLLLSWEEGTFKAKRE